MYIMDRLNTNYTKHELKDSYETKRKNIISQNKYSYMDYPQQTRETDINKNIEDIHKKDITYHPIQQDYIAQLSQNPKELYIHNFKDTSKHELLQSQPTIIPMTYNRHQELYLPEIGEKRKLSNIIYHNLIQSYQQYKIIQEEELLNIINQLDDITNWNKDKTKHVVSQLKTIYEMKRTKNEEGQKEPSSQEHYDLFEKETKTIDYYVTIDSNDRYKKNWENPNEYQIMFEPNTILNDEYTGFINKSFHNVVSVELLECIIPKTSKEGTNYETLPYLLLEIDELGNTYQGTNTYTNKIFAQLIFDKVVGHYRYCSFNDNRQIKKIFNPRISLNKFTIRFLKPNGELYNFGKSYELEHDTIEPNNILTFKITTIQRELNTMYLNQKN